MRTKLLFNYGWPPGPGDHIPTNPEPAPPPGYPPPEPAPPPPPPQK